MYILLQHFRVSEFSESFVVFSLNERGIFKKQLNSHAGAWELETGVDETLPQSRRVIYCFPLSCDFLGNHDNKMLLFWYGMKPTGPSYFWAPKQSCFCCRLGLLANKIGNYLDHICFVLGHRLEILSAQVCTYRRYIGWFGPHSWFCLSDFLSWGEAKERRSVGRTVAHNMLLMFKKLSANKYHSIRSRR